MAHFLLIHGSWHGAWCWFKIKPRLESEGHRVTAPDLLGRINNPARPFAVSLKRLIKDISQYLPQDEKTIIVVHSRYGVLASQLAEYFPDRIDRVIYLASYMVPNNARAASYFRRDVESFLTPYVKISKAGLWDSLAPEIYQEGLYHDCAPEDVALAARLLGKEPLRPALAKLQLSDANFGRVPKAYIRLTEDRAVTIKLQDFMLNAIAVGRVESLETSHSAYFSQPDKLSRTILKVSSA